jgi:hypothetical protein
MTALSHVRSALTLVALVAPPAAASSTAALPTSAREAANDSAADAARHVVHTTRGVVKSVASDAIVVARPKGRGEITFRLRSSAHRNGTIAVGVVVSVRYEDEGDAHVALAVAVQRP